MDPCINIHLPKSDRHRTPAANLNFHHTPANFPGGVGQRAVSCHPSSPRVIEQLKRTNQRPVTLERFAVTALEGDGSVIGAKCYFECSARTGGAFRRCSITRRLVLLSFAQE